MSETPLIGTGNLKAGCLDGQVAIITGAGRAIGFESARALAWLGARVVIAEVNPRTGRDAAQRINAEMGPGKALFFRTDVGSERSVRRMARRVLKAWGRVDIVLNNATIAPVGPVHEVDIGAWDASYRVNLRGPVLLARTFLPAMITRKAGVFVCVSSAPGPFMGPYETMKTAQVELANIAAGELEESGVSVFSIGPGIVRTPALEAAMPKLAPLYGKTVEEFFVMSAAHEVTVEAAGAGFAAAIALAPRFHGQLIGSKQALIAAGIDIPDTGTMSAARELSPDAMKQGAELCHQVRTTLLEQSNGWKERPLFERQWVVRDFKKEAGQPVELWLEDLERLEIRLSDADSPEVPILHVPLSQLEGYYRHMAQMAEGYEKDPEVRRRNVEIVMEWAREVQRLEVLLNGESSN